MKKFILFIILVVISQLAFGQTPIPGGNVSGNWTIANSPYQINGDIVVQAGSILTIDAGVIVSFEGHYSFTINGELNINGTNGNLVVISATDQNVGWSGLRFENSSATSIIDYTIISYGNATGSSPEYRGGGIYVSETDNLTISNCVVTNCSAIGSGGGMFIDNSDITIDNCSISANTAAGGGGLSITNSNPTILNSVIEDNVTTYDGAGLYIANSDIDISFTEISGNSTDWNGGGICTFNNANVSLTSVTITNNLANLSGSGLANRYNSNVTILNSILYGNAFNNIDNQNSCNIIATYSDLEYAEDEDFFGDGCIDANPLFDVNYHLTWANIPTPDETKSPCIDSGNPAYSDPDGTNVDMGAYYFIQSGIRGTVTLNGGTGQVTDVLVEAHLRVAPFTIYTTYPDSNGNFLINVPDGNYDVFVSLAGYNSATYLDIDVIDIIYVIPNIELTPPPSGFVSGQVTLEGIGNIGNVVISAGGEQTNPFIVEDVYGNITWHYRLELSPGTYDVMASLAGYENEVISNVNIQPSQEVENQNFHLDLVIYYGDVEGTVELVNGAGIITDVVISCDGVTTHPAADGTYLLENVHSGNNKNIVASLAGYAPVTIDNVSVITDHITGDIDFKLLAWDTVTGTVYSTTMYLTTTYDGNFIRGNDRNTQLGIFDTSGECRGVATWMPGIHPQWYSYFTSDGYWFLTIVSSDNSGTEELNFKVYDSENDVIYDCTESFFFPTDPSNDFNMNLTIPSPTHTQTFELIQDWNWISINLTPTSSAVTDVFDVLEPLSIISSDLAITTQGESTIFDPIGLNDWVGDFTHINNYTGYKLHIPNDYPNFTVSGKKINPIINPIFLEDGYDAATNNKGYNWISYLPYEELDLDTALQSLSIPDSSIIKSQTQSAVYYGNWIGDLTTMEPGVAYLLKWHEAMDPEDPIFLTYPLETSRTAPADNYKPQTDWQVTTGNEHNMIVMAEIEGNQDISLGLFDKYGVCHSIGKYIQNFWYFTVTESDTELYFKKIDNQTKIESNSKTSILFSADTIIGNPKKPIKVDFRDEENITELPLILEQNSPNPFNPSTTIRFQIPKKSHTKLEVYNSKGQKIKTLVNDELSAGAHQIVWNGDDNSSKPVVSGVYFYRLTNGKFQQTNKMLLIK